MDAAIEKSAMRKTYLRLLPFAVLSYILAYIDRINVSFAALTFLEYAGRLADDDPLYLRRHRHARLGSHFRLHE